MSVEDSMADVVKRLLANNNAVAVVACTLLAKTVGL